MKYADFEAELLAAGCVVVRKGGSHFIWYSPLTNTKFALGHHGAKEVPKGTMLAIRRQAGIKRKP